MTRNGSTPTDQRLIAAALLEFNELGYAGTNTNRIAKRAGFAPQTFYRWFDDKEAIFLAAYAHWQRQEWETIGSLVREQANHRAVATAVIEHHCTYAGFRRCLRQLTGESTAILAARSDSRRAQATKLLNWLQLPEAAEPEALLVLLQWERLADAVADGETEALNIPVSTVEQTMLSLVTSLKSAPI